MDTSLQTSLHILVVDDRPESVLFLTEFLLSRKHRVATIGNGKEALASVVRRRAANDPYDLVISELNVPGLDGLTLFKELRRRQEPIEVVVCTAYAAMHPTLRQDADRVGCLAIVDKPADLQKLEEIVTLTRGRKRASPGTSKTEQPFFGTSRTVRAADVKTASIRREPGPMSAGLERRDAPPTAPAAPEASSMQYPSPLPFDEGSDRLPRRQVQSYSHNSSDAPLASGQKPPTGPEYRPGTGRESRPTTDRQQRPPAAIPVAPEAIPVPRPNASPGQANPPSKPLAPVTTRLRRTVTGTERITRTNPPAGAAHPENSRAVGCASCGKTFAVVNKPEAYSVVCVHCGQLNTIDPLLS